MAGRASISSPRRGVVAFDMDTEEEEEEEEGGGAGRLPAAPRGRRMPYKLNLPPEFQTGMYRRLGLHLALPP